MYRKHRGLDRLTPPAIDGADASNAQMLGWKARPRGCRPAIVLWKLYRSWTQPHRLICRIVSFSWTSDLSAEMLVCPRFALQQPKHVASDDHAFLPLTREHLAALLFGDGQ